MSRLVLVAVVLLALLALVTMVAGCPRTPAPPPLPVNPNLPNAVPATPGTESPDATTVTPTAPTGEMGKIVAAHEKVLNYNVTIKIGDKTVMKAAVKAEAGKPSVVRATTSSGYILVLRAEQAQYLLNTSKETATKQALGKQGKGYLGKLISPMALAAKNPIISDDKLGQVECWRLDWTDDKGTQVQMWMDKKNGLPQKATHGQVVTMYTHEKIDQLPESVFTMPTGYEVKEITVPATTGTAATPPATHATGTTAAPPPPSQPAPAEAGETSPAPALTPAH